MLERYKKLIVWITFAILLAIPALWFTHFEGFLYIHNGTNIPLFPGEATKYNYIWDSSNLGFESYLSKVKLVSFAPYTFLINLGLTARTTQIIVFSIMFALPFLAFYFGLSKIFKEKQFPAQYLGAILYTLNLYVVIMWHSGIHPSASYIPYILAPAVFGMHYKILTEKTRLYYRVLFIFVLSISLSKHAYSLAQIIIPNFVLFLMNMKKLDFKRLLKDYLIIGISTILISIWWLFPMLLRYSSTFSNALKISSRFLTTQTNLSNEPNVFELAGLRTWAFGEQWGGRYFMSFSESYVTMPYLNILWVIFLVFLLGVSGYYLYTLKPPKRRKNKKDKEEYNSLDRQLIIFSYIITGISLFLAKRSNPPFGKVSDFFIQKVPVINLLRTPDTKLLGTFVFGLSILTVISVGYMLDRYSDKVRQSIIVSSVLVIVIAYSFPIYNGFAVIEKRAGTQYDRVVNIPNYYITFSDKIKSFKNNLNIIQLPPVGQGLWELGGDDGYWGLDILTRMIKKPVLVSSQLDTTNYIHSSDLIELAIRKPSKEMLDLLRVGYLLFRGGAVDNTKYPSAEYYQQYFSDKMKSGIEEVSDLTGNAELYLNNDKDALSLAEDASNRIYYSGDQQSFVSSDLVLSNLATSTFDYDFNNSKQLSDSTTPIILGAERYDQKYVSRLKSGMTPTNCPENLLCYKVYNPLLDVSEYAVSTTTTQNVNSIIVDSTNIADAQGFVNNGNISLKSGENDIYVVPNVTVKNYSDNEITFAEGSKNMHIDVAPTTDVLTLDFFYNTDFPIVITVNYSFYEPESIDREQSDLQTIKREATFKATNGEWVEAPIQMLPQRNIVAMDISITQYSSQGVKTMAPVQLRDVKVLQVSAPNLYFVKNVENIAGEKNQIDIKKINPTRYVVDSGVLGQEALDNIVFYQSYSNNWIITLQNDTKLLNKLPLGISQFISKVFLGKPYYKDISSEHFMANSYANGWVLDKSTLDNFSDWDNLVVEHKLQRSVYLFGYISLSTLFVLVGFIVWDFHKNKI